MKKSKIFPTILQHFEMQINKDITIQTYIKYRKKILNAKYVIYKNIININIRFLPDNHHF